MSLDIYTNMTVGAETVWIDSKSMRNNPDCVYKVTASDQELKRALHITGLPQYGASMKFYGDTAKYIVGNWFN